MKPEMDHGFSVFGLRNHSFQNLECFQRRSVARTSDPKLGGVVVDPLLLRDILGLVLCQCHIYIFTLNTTVSCFFEILVLRSVFFFNGEDQVITSGHHASLIFPHTGYKSLTMGCMFLFVPSFRKQQNPKDSPRQRR